MEISPLEQQQLDAIASSGLEIPARPQVVMEVQQMLHDPDSDNRAIARLIGRDVKLTATVFKTVNSALYGLGTKIDNLDKALATLGHKQMENVVNAAGLRQQLGGDASRFERFWDRSTDLATLCSIVADKAVAPKLLSSEHAYMVGLFHDCGVPALMQHIPGYCADLAKNNGPLPSVLDEDDSHGTSHCLVGHMIVQQWGLPECIARAVRTHHYVLDDSQEPKTATAVLQFATHIYNVNQGHDDTEWGYQGARATAELGIAEEALEELEREIWSSFDFLH